MTSARRLVFALAWLCHLVWTTTPAAADPTVAQGFTLETFVADILNPRSMAFPNPGSAFTAFFYVSSDTAPVTNFGLPAQQFVDDKIFAISASGGVAEFASLPGETDPVGFAFPPPGSSFGDLLYLSGNNRDGYQFGDQGGAVLVIDPLSAWADFTDVPPIDLGEPADIAFGPGGAFGTDLYIANLRDWAADMFIADSAGALTIFVNDGIIDPQPGGLGLLSMAFSPGGGFGEDLFVYNQNCDCIQRINALGTLPLTDVPLAFAHPRDVAFAPGGAFGGDLYVAAGSDDTTDEIWRVRPDGTTTRLASGFERLFLKPLAFSPDGSALFVADYGADKIYRISTTGIDVAIDVRPGSDRNRVNLRSAGVIPVAIFSSDDFDAATIEPDTVSLAGAAVQMVGKGDRYLCHIKDVNEDMLDDLFCHIETAEMIIEPGVSKIVLEAFTDEGKAVRGEDFIQIVPNRMRPDCPSHARCGAGGPPPHKPTIKQSKIR